MKGITKDGKKVDVIEKNGKFFVNPKSIKLATSGDVKCMECDEDGRYWNTDVVFQSGSLREITRLACSSCGSTNVEVI